MTDVSGKEKADMKRKQCIVYIETVSAEGGMLREGVDLVVGKAMDRVGWGFKYRRSAPLEWRRTCFCALRCEAMRRPKFP